MINSNIVKPKTLCAIPCYNESVNLPSLFEDIKNNDFISEVDVVFIDDCSTDSTKKIITSHNYRCISHEFNKGYGGSVQTAFKYALTNKYDYLLIFPGDHQRRVSDALKMLGEIKSKKLDVIVGSKFHIYSEKYGPIGRRFGNQIYSKFAKFMWSSPIQDVLSGFKIYRVNAIAPFFQKLPTSYALDIVFSYACAKFGLRIAEIDVFCRYDRHTTKMRSIALVSARMFATLICWMFVHNISLIKRKVSSLKSCNEVVK